MTESGEPAKKGLNPLTLVSVIVIAIFPVIGGIFSPISNEFVPGIEGIVDTLLDVATYLST